jgi:hypothetical protein
VVVLIVVVVGSGRAELDVEASVEEEVGVDAAKDVLGSGRADVVLVSCVVLVDSGGAAAVVTGSA